MGIRDSTAGPAAPAAAMAFGLGGLIPFLGLAGLALVGPSSSGPTVMLMLAQYGAGIASLA